MPRGGGGAHRDDENEFATQPVALTYGVWTIVAVRALWRVWGFERNNNMTTIYINRGGCPPTSRCIINIAGKAISAVVFFADASNTRRKDAFFDERIRRRRG